MKYKINLKIYFFIISIIFLVLTFFLLQSTYARYITALTATSTVEMGSWLIRVNDQNIMDNSDITEKLEPVFNSNPTYIAEGKIVPTSTGYVDIKLDYSDVTVPFEYKISVETDPVLEDFSISSCSTNTGILPTQNDNIFTAKVLPTETTRIQTLTFNFAWIDDGTLTDVQDTNFSRDNSQLGLRFNIEFIQLVPENT